MALFITWRFVAFTVTTHVYHQMGSMEGRAQTAFSIAESDVQLVHIGYDVAPRLMQTGRTIGY